MLYIDYDFDLVSAREKNQALQEVFQHYRWEALSCC